MTFKGIAAFKLASSVLFFLEQETTSHAMKMNKSLKGPVSQKERRKKYTNKNTTK